MGDVLVFLVGVIFFGALWWGVVRVIIPDDFGAPDEEPDFSEELRRKELEGLRAERDQLAQELDVAVTALIALAHKLQRKMIDHPNN